MAEKQLILAVESTAAMGPFWQTVVSDYLEKIVRSFCGNELPGQNSSTSIVELSLVMFNAHGSYCACLVQRSAWTRDVDIFLQCLSALRCAGGSSNDAAIAEGLAEALMMFLNSSNGTQPQQNVDGQKHCVLVAASNPYPLPTPVYRPQVQNLEQSENIEFQIRSHVSDAEAVAKSFAQCSVSLSVICPKQLPKLRAIYNAAKQNPRAADPAFDNVKNPHFLVLISEKFREARAALSHPGITSLTANQSPVKMDIPSVTSVTVKGSIMSRQPVSVGYVPAATVKVEPITETSIVSGPAFPHISSVQHTACQGIPALHSSSQSSASQDMITDGYNVQELKPMASSTLQAAQAKYVKIWEGNLCGQRQGQSIFITGLEGYRSASASETLAANWPPIMQIVRLMTLDHMNNKQYVGKANFFVFRAMNRHGFLEQLQEKKLCAVIQLPSQTLLLSVSDKACRLIGMLFSGDTVVFKPQIYSQQQQQHTQLQQQVSELQPPQQLPQQQLLQLQQQQQQQQLLQLQQQMVETGMGQAYVHQGPGRSQLVTQGQVSSQGPPNVSGGGFMPKSEL